MRRSFSPVCVVALALLLPACTTLLQGDVRNTGGTDAGPRDAALTDTGPVSCTEDDECNDDNECDGVERCSITAGVGTCVEGMPLCMMGCVQGRMPPCEEDCEDADGDGVTNCNGDCDDTNPDARPGGDETCATLADEDCNPATLGSGGEDQDTDRDWAPECCDVARCGTDCDDNDADRAGTLPELCNGVDDDCDPRIDEGYPDTDGDGFGESGAAQVTGACPAVAPNDADCDDRNALINPDRHDICGTGVDEDCDGRLDDGGAAPWYSDCDGDGYGAPNPEAPRSCGVPTTAPSCSGGGGVWSSLGGDCADMDDAVRPGRLDVCDEVNDDCDALTDEDGDDACAQTSAGGVARCSVATGACGIPICPIGFENCDDLIATGCESDSRVDRLNCGTCDNACNYRCADAACRTPTAISLGDAHSCAVTSDQRVECWGRNAEGQVGDGSVTDATRPVRLALANVTGVSAGLLHTCAVVGSAVHCWGSNLGGQLAAPSAVLQSPDPLPVSGITSALAVAAGGRFSCALLADRSVQCWGNNDRGQLGRGTTGGSHHSPVAVMGLSNVVELHAGEEFACARDTSADVWCWGSNANGQIGAGLPGAVSVVPARVDSLGGDALDLAVGRTHACAVVDPGSMTHTVQCWGANAVGQLGDASMTQRNVPVTVNFTFSGGERFVTVSAGGNHTCAMRERNSAGLLSTLYCWGLNSDDQLNVIAAGNQTVPTVTSLSHAGVVGGTRVALGGRHTCYIDERQFLRCWGRGDSGQLGQGTTAPSSDPLPVFGP